MMSFAVLAFALGATAESVNLSPDNFNAEVMSGKNAFIKFQAPW